MTMRWPETKGEKVVAALGLLVAVGVVVPLAFVVWFAATFSAGSFAGMDGPFPGPVTARTVYEDLDEVADGDERLGSGAQYRCRLVAVRRDGRHPRAYRCVVPGHGAGDLGYRVTVARSTSCWRARGDAPPASGCITVTGDAGGGGGLD
jgi:hypothetical protein